MYYKSVNLSSDKDCFNFLHDHFRYDVMNSWNNMVTIANNVKLYNLPVDFDLAYQALEEDDYFNVNENIRYWEEEHPGTQVYFNGKSGGYLVLREKELESFIKYYDYDDFKQDIQESWGSLKAYHSHLVELVKLVQDFDKLCDDLVNVVKYLVEQLQLRKENTRQFYATKTNVTYSYENKEYQKYHELYMEEQGYEIENSDSTNLTTTYKTIKLTNGEVVLPY